MLDGIKPLADEVLGNIMKNHYPKWYKKCIAVKYSKKVKKLFQVFGMLAINYNCATEFHIDLNDNGLYIVVPVGE